MIDSEQLKVSGWDSTEEELAARSRTGVIAHRPQGGQESTGVVQQMRIKLGIPGTIRHWTGDDNPGWSLTVRKRTGKVILTFLTTGKRPEKIEKRSTTDDTELHGSRRREDWSADRCRSGRVEWARKRELSSHRCTRIHADNATDDRKFKRWIARASHQESTGLMATFPPAFGRRRQSR